MGVPIRLILSLYSFFHLSWLTLSPGSSTLREPRPVLESRWEHLHAGRGVAFSGQGSDTFYDITGLDI